MDPFDVFGDPCVDSREVPLCAAILVTRPEPSGHNAHQGGHAVLPVVDASSTVSAAGVRAGDVVVIGVGLALRPSKAHVVGLIFNQSIIFALFCIGFNSVEVFLFPSTHLIFAIKFISSVIYHGLAVIHGKHIKFGLLELCWQDSLFLGPASSSEFAKALAPSPV